MRAESKSCENCGKVWRSYTYTPCDKGPDCWECNMMSVGLREPVTEHGEAHDDVREVETYRCPHGVAFSLFCTGCNHRVSGWGIGSAGFGELCGCSEEED